MGLLMPKLWHDDVRRPPDDSWLWARTNQQAQKILSENSITEASLDHDLGLDYVDPDMPDADIQTGWDTDNDGAMLVRWMIEHDLLPPKVTIHSWNPDGAKRMAGLIDQAVRLLGVKCECAVKPYHI